MNVPFDEEPGMAFIGARFDEIPLPVDRRIPLEYPLDEVPDAVAPDAHLPDFGPDYNSIVGDDSHDAVDVLRVDRLAESVENSPDVARA